MVTLADLRARNVQPAWQEAVAVVQELVQTITSTGVSLPDLDFPPGTIFVDPATITLTDRRHQGGFTVQDTGGSNSVIVRSCCERE